MKTGFIKLYRKMVDWQWYHDNNVFRLFLHLLITANYKDKKWLNIVVKRGQRVFTIPSLAEEINLSEQQTRTALAKLKGSQDVSVKSTNRYSLVTVVKYSNYQDISEEVNRQNNRQITDKQQTNNRQITTTKEYKEYKKERNIYSSSIKHKYGEYKNILLTDKELQSLKSDYNNYDQLIKYLSEYKEMKGIKYKSDYLAIRKWVVEAVKRNCKVEKNLTEDKEWIEEMKKKHGEEYF